MKRLAVPLLSLALLAAPLAAEAQQASPVPRIGVLRPGLPLGPYIETFRRALRDLGYVEGRNVIIEFRWAHGRADRLPELAADLARLPLDLIVVAGTKPTRAVQRATGTIPIVMVAVGDPVSSRFVRSLDRPGGNITGVTLLGPGLGGKRLALLKQLAPSATRVAVLRNPDTLPDVVPLWGDTETEARKLGVQLHVHDVRNTAELSQAFDAMARDGAEVLLVLPDPTFTANRGHIAELAAKSRIPTMYEAREFVVAGGLVSYAASLADQFSRAAVYVDRILKGAKPASLPIEQPTKFELVINLKSAKALGLTIPPSVLTRADEVIQ
jgi:putative tryptophan/tyrosine transport system substrate-binding protein